MNKVFKHLSLAAAVATATLVSVQASAYEAGDWLVRAGVVNVDPTDGSDGIAVPVLGGVGAYPGGEIAGTGVEADDDTQLGLTVTYMMTSNVGVELLAATPFTHDITADLGGLGKVNAGEATQLPPTVSLVWYPMGSAGQVSPYVGAGINYTVFFEEDVSGDLEAGLSGVADAVTGVSVGLPSPVGLDMKLHDSVGVALQAGVDVALTEQWMLNASVRWIDIDTEAKITSALGNTITIDDIQIDPWVYQLNVGYKF